VKDENGLCGKPGAGAHGRRAGPCARVVSAKDEAEAVDEEEAWKRQLL